MSIFDMNADHGFWNQSFRLFINNYSHSARRDFGNKIMSIFLLLVVVQNKMDMIL